MANSVSPVGNIARGFFNRFQFGLSASTNNHDGLSNNLSSDEPLALWIDRKLVDKVTRILTKIVKLCQRPKMNLKNNPPYIIDILTQIQHHILTVIQEQRGDLDKLNQIEYLTFYFGNLMKKCKYTTNLFKAAKEKIYDTRTIYRCTLNKMSLIFSHMLTELKAIFPSGQYNIDDYRIVDEGACQFWKESFRSR
ncbi:E3 ubiquitin-protein ligase CBL [Trichoplax sp. H2]|nr:E3 ubiquitin-protein ligase CBL [Trichoplax sp. H2]|eukprot:RDD39660.1 E3 ubiquitin-protein ligase CBL [Trichoplax sp. H2]